MTQDVYRGDLDWDRIYRFCHGADAMAKAIGKALGAGRERVLFAGFPPVASALVRERPLTFVDRSAVVTAAAASIYPNLSASVTDDVLSHLAACVAPHVVISGRVTAFWDSAGAFDALRAAVLSSPRECVVVDYFDAALARKGRRFDFGAPPTSGRWRILSIAQCDGVGPRIARVRMRVAYTLDQDQQVFEAERSFFHAGDVLEWAVGSLPGYRALIAPPLIPGDPSFTLILRAG